MPRNPSSQIQRGEPVKLTVNGKAVQAFAGETLATVLLAQGITIFNRTASGKARGPYCNMGTCYECQVQVSDPKSQAQKPSWVRACMMTVREGIELTSGARLQSPPQSSYSSADETDDDE